MKGWVTGVDKNRRKKKGERKKREGQLRQGHEVTMRNSLKVVRCGGFAA